MLRISHRLKHVLQKFSMQLIYSHNITESDLPLLGGKASGLYRLQQLGFHVPKFIVIPWTEIAQLQTEGGFDILKDTILQHLPTDALLAVRSSALQEDGAQHSFAGMYQTLLNVTCETLPEALKTVAQSANSERIETYRKQHNLTGNPAVSIIVQQMVEADVSGVAFGLHPVTGETDVKVINSAYGLGEGLVSGQLTADTFEIRNDEIQSVIATKDLFFTKNAQNANITQPVADDLQNKPSLTDEQIHELTKALKTIEAQFHFKPDIEFAYHNDQLYLLQARPITSFNSESKIKNSESNPVNPEILSEQNSIFENTKTLSRDEPPNSEFLILNSELKTVWDNSNIVESYPGLTLPLTYSFISKVYEAVYRQLSLVMGIDARVIEEHRSVYANMLGHICGRVYYNLNSWHTALSLLPGYGNNREFMDKMMGTKEKFDVQVLENMDRYHTPWRRVKSIARMMQSLLSVKKDRDRFVNYFHSVYTKYTALDYSQRTLPQLRNDYRQFENTLLKEWKAPLVNDLFCMMYFGWLQKLVARHAKDASGTLLNDLLSASRNVMTIEPAVRMQAFSAKIRQNAALLELFLQQESEVVWARLPTENPDLYREIQSYLQQWGHRCMAELKLETVSYAMQPTLWIQQLQLLLKSPGVPASFGKAEEQKIAAEQTMQNALKGKPLQRLLFSHVLKKARYFVSNRENLRYERTKAFAIVRQLFLSMGEKLAAQSHLQHPRDIFYLTQQEVFDFIDTNQPTQNLNSIVAERKTLYARYESIHVPERFTSYGLHLPDFQVQTETSTNGHASQLKGIAASAGVVEGVVQVVHHPHEVKQLQGDILVTVSTDPGWVVLFPGCKGILVERGSLLSHAAIVSREMGIPCIVGIPNLTKLLKTGDKVLMNGGTGEIHLRPS
jgi:pyruvate,water dikinase